MYRLPSQARRRTFAFLAAVGLAVANGPAAATEPGLLPVGAKPPPPGFVSLLIDTERLTLTVFSDSEVWHRFPVATGKPETPTAIGEWRITDKAIWGGAFGARWMGLSIPWARYGIHGTDRPRTIGSPASHGCVRMRDRDVITLYSWVRTGTPVKVTGRPRTHFGELPRTIRPGYRGSDVMRLQSVLREIGIYQGQLDGRYGAATTRAVRTFQWAHFLPVTGVADAATRRALGLP